MYNYAQTGIETGTIYKLWEIYVQPINRVIVQLNFSDDLLCLKTICFRYPPDIKVCQPKLCNGTHLVVRKLITNVIRTTRLQGKFRNEEFLIPIISMIGFLNKDQQTTRRIFVFVECLWLYSCTCLQKEKCCITLGDAKKGTWQSENHLANTCKNATFANCFHSIKQIP